jgi:hypothetical protein
MQTSITQTQLDTIAADLDPAARELAHSHGPETAEAFAVQYVRAVAEVCGALASRECPYGEGWAPVDFLEGCTAAIRDAAEAVGIEMEPADWRSLFRLYEDPSDSAYDHAGIGRPVGRFVVCREDGSLSTDLRTALCATEEEAEAAVESMAASGYDDHVVRARLVHHL